MYITLLIVSMFILFVYIKTKVHSGKLKLDKSIYDVPEIDDVLIVVKPFYYDGSVLKYRIYSMHSKPNTIYIEKGTELKVKNISAQKYDWILQINNNMYLEYFQTKKYWITKKNLREKKLNKILK